ncbi:IS5/IS1182 family transposase, partial [Pseudoxanthomonas sp. CAU 1598]|nr:IS5/IS1182 family transposase [Pseudomarimonas arenosa]
MSKFIVIDHAQALLLPPDLREWVPEDDLVNFVIEAARRVPVTKFKVN